MAAAPVEPSGRCQRCGFDPHQLAPPDAATAVRSLARRWRELLDGVAEREEEGDTLLRCRLGGDMSPLERAAHVVDVFERKAAQLNQVWEHEAPALDEVGITAGRAEDVAVDRADLVGDLAGAGERLARVIERYEGGDWGRTGHRGRERVIAWQLATDAIHEASHQLRVCRDDLETVCALPLDDEEE